MPTGLFVRALRDAALASAVAALLFLPFVFFRLVDYAGGEGIDTRWHAYAATIALIFLGSLMLSLIEAGWYRVPFVLMIVVDAVVWSAIVYSPVPLIQVMSGVEDPKAMLISNAAISVLMLSTISFPVWLILGVLCAYVWRPVWSVPDPRPARKAWPLYLFAACSITVWAILALVMRS